MTVPTTNSTETLLQELMKTVSTFTKEISELKKANNVGSNVNPRKRLRDSKSKSQAVACDGEDNTDQPSDNVERDSNPPSDVEDHKSSGTVERFKLSEEGETFLETVFSSKMEYATIKAKVGSSGNQTPGGLGAQSSAQ